MTIRPTSSDLALENNQNSSKKLRMEASSEKRNSEIATAYQQNKNYFTSSEDQQNPSLGVQDTQLGSFNLNPLTFSTIYYQLNHGCPRSVLEKDPALHKKYIYDFMKKEDLSLEQIRCVPKEIWVIALEENPQEIMFYLHLAKRLDVGETVELTGDRTLTEHQLYLKALALNPNYSKTYRDLAQFLRRKKDQASLDAARQLYVKGIEINPSCPHSYIGIADLLGEDSFCKIKSTIFSKDKLCMKLLNEYAQCGDVYRCLADCLQEKRMLLQLSKYKLFNIHQLYLTSLEMDCKNVKAYIGLYREAHYQQAATLFFKDEKMWEEDYILTAITTAPFDPELTVFFQQKDLLKSERFCPFLQKLSAMEISSKIKFWVYEAFLGQLLYAPSLEEVQITFIKALINVIRQEAKLQKTLTREEEKLRKSAAIFYKKIQKELFPKGVDFFQMSDEALFRVKSCHQHKDISYPYLVRELVRNNIQQDEDVPLWSKKMAQLLAHVICSCASDPLSYAFLVDYRWNNNIFFLNKKRYLAYLDFSLMLYTTILEVDPHFLEGLLGLSRILQTVDRHQKKVNFKSPVIKEYLFQDSHSDLDKIVIDKCSVKLPNQTFISFQEIIKKIIDASSSASFVTLKPFILDLIYFIHGYPSEATSYESLLTQMKEKGQRPFDIIELCLAFLKEELMIGLAGIGPCQTIILAENQYDPRLEKRKQTIQSLLFQLSQQIQLLSFQSVTEKGLHFQQEPLMTYPAMARPESSLDELCDIPMESWSAAFHGFECNSYFYYNLARYLLALDITEDQHKKYIHLFYCGDLNLDQLVSVQKKSQLIWDLLFKSLRLNPANIKTYHLIAENLVFLDKEYGFLAPVFAELLHLLCIDIQPGESENYLSLLAVNRDASCYQLFSGIQMDTQALFLKALSLEFDKQKKLSFIVFAENRAIHSDVMELKTISKEMESHKAIPICHLQDQVEAHLSCLTQQFPQANIYFILNHSSNPYLLYQTAASSFERPFYILDYFSHRFHCILGDTAHLGIQDMRKWIQAESLAGGRPLFVLGIISQSSLPRQKKLKLYSALYTAIVERPVMSRKLKHIFADLLASYIRIGEHSYENIRNNLIKESRYSDYKNYHFERIFLRNSYQLFEPSDTSIECTLEECPCKDKDIFSFDELNKIKKKLFAPIYPSDYRRYVTAHLVFAEHLKRKANRPHQGGEGNFPLSVQDVDIKILQLAASRPADWESVDKKLRAAFYVRLADSLNEDEVICRAKPRKMEPAVEEESSSEENEEEYNTEEEEISSEENEEEYDAEVTFVIEPAHHSSSHPASTFTKSHLYFKAIQTYPFLLEAYTGLERLYPNAFELITDAFPEKKPLQEQITSVENALRTTPHWEDLEEYTEEEREALGDRKEKRLYESVQYLKRSNAPITHLFPSIIDFYLKMIDHQPNAACAYYLLANQLGQHQQNQIQLLNRVWVTRQELYKRSVQLNVTESKAYYQVAIHLEDRKAVALFDGKTVLSKLDLLAAAFMRSAHSYFYLAELTRELKKQSQK